MVNRNAIIDNTRRFKSKILSSVRRLSMWYLLCTSYNKIYTLDGCIKCWLHVIIWYDHTEPYRYFIKKNLTVFLTRVFFIITLVHRCVFSIISRYIRLCAPGTRPRSHIFIGGKRKKIIMYTKINMIYEKKIYISESGAILLAYFQHETCHRIGIFNSIYTKCGCVCIYTYPL